MWSRHISSAEVGRRVLYATDSELEKNWRISQMKKQTNKTTQIGFKANQQKGKTENNKKILLRIDQRQPV